jgi:hypothetical protein
LTALDGIGTKLYLLDFVNCKPVSHSVGYDYDSSDVITHHLVLNYEQMIRYKNPKAV